MTGEQIYVSWVDVNEQNGKGIQLIASEMKWIYLGIYNVSLNKGDSVRLEILLKRIEDTLDNLGVKDEHLQNLVKSAQDIAHEIGNSFVRLGMYVRSLGELNHLISSYANTVSNQ